MPVRYWQSVDLPVPNMAIASAFITLFLGFALGISGYFGYLERLRNPPGVNILDISEMQLTGKLPETAEVSMVPSGLAMTAPFAFALFTPLGLLATYLVLSSLLRLISSYTGEPFGDPLLTGVDIIARKSFTRQQQYSVRSAREKLEGAVEPDRRYDGEWAGLSGVDFVIVSARRKPDWTKGTFVITSEGWFTLGEPFDRPMPNGMRTVYPLTLQTTPDVVRKSVNYELPALRPASAAAGRPGRSAPALAGPPPSEGRPPKSAK